MKTAMITVVMMAAMVTALFFWQQGQATGLQREIKSLQVRRTSLEEARLLDGVRPGSHGEVEKTGATEPRTIRQLLAAADEPIDTKTLMEGLMQALMTQDMLGMLRICLPISRLSSEARDELLTEIQEFETNPQGKQIMLQILMAFADSSDPAKTLERSLSMDMQPHAYANHLSSWAKKNPQAALAWYRSKQNEGALDGKGLGQSPETILFGSMLSGIALTDPDLALALFDEVDKKTRGQAIDQMTSALANAGVEGEPKLRALIEGLEENERTSALSSAGSSIANKRSWDEALAFIDTFELDPSDRTAAVSSIAGSDHRKEPKEKIDWLLAHVPEDQTTSAVESMVRTLGWQNTKSLDAWVDSQPRGGIRDAAQSARAQGLAQRQQFDDGFTRALDIDEEAKRTEALTSVIRGWRRQDEAVARERVERAGLDPVDFGFVAPSNGEDGN